MTKIFSSAFIPVFLAVFIGYLSGCSKSQDASPKVIPKAFDTAPAELQKEWEKILTASQSSDYATAILTCRKLQMRSDISPEQRSSIDGTMNEVNERLTAAAQKGDVAAQKALQDIRAQWR